MNTSIPGLEKANFYAFQTRIQPSWPLVSFESLTVIPSIIDTFLARHWPASKFVLTAGWNYACAGAWRLSRKDVIAENKMAPLLQYFVLMAIIVSIEGRKDVFKCSVCGKNLSNLKAERRKFRAVSDDLFACFGPLEGESPHEPGKKFLCGTCRRALADFKRTGKTFFHVSKNAISQQSVTICVS